MCWGVTDVVHVYALPLHHHSKAMWTLNKASIAHHFLSQHCESMCWGVTDVVHVYALPLHHHIKAMWTLNKASIAHHFLSQHDTTLLWNLGLWVYGIETFKNESV